MTEATPGVDVRAVTGSAVASIGDELHTFFRWLDDGLNTLDLAEWTMLALGGVLLWRALALFRARREIGPITVADPATANEDDGRPLGAVMRESLSRAGLAPKLLPVGRPEDTGALVKASPIPRVGWITALVSYVNGFLRRLTDVGFRAESTLHPTGEDYAKITAVLRRNLSGRLVAIRTLQGNTAENAARRAAYWLYTETAKAETKRSNFDPSQRWTNSEALLRYQDGAAHEEAGCLGEALTAYKESVRLEHRNVLPHLAVGNVHEQLAVAPPPMYDASEARQALLDALASYIAVAHLWPDEPEGRYRLANLCSFTEIWRSTWANVDASNPQLRRLQQLAGQIDPPNRDGIVEVLLRRSAREYEELLSRLPGKREELRPMTRIAQLCTCLHISPGSYAKQQAEVSAVLARRRMIWNTKYNGACFYALAIDYSVPELKRGQVNRALALLDEVVVDPKARLSLGWITSDPDLAPLRAWLAAEQYGGTDPESQRRAAWRALLAATP